MRLHAGPWLVLIGLACARAISVPVEHSLDGATYEPAGRIEFDADVLVRMGTNRAQIGHNHWPSRSPRPRGSLKTCV